MCSVDLDQNQQGNNQEFNLPLTPHPVQEREFKVYKEREGKKERIRGRKKEQKEKRKRQKGEKGSKN